VTDLLISEPAQVAVRPELPRRLQVRVRSRPAGVGGCCWVVGRPERGVRRPAG